MSTDRAEADNAQLVATWRLDNGQAFVAGVSRKTRLPTLKERFSGGLGSAVPNPGLDPERALHYELGFQQKGTNWGAKIAVFHSDLDDAIQTITLLPSACSSPPCTQLQNVGEQRNRGVELSADYALSDTLRLSAQANFVDIDNRSDPSVRPTGIPEEKYLVSANWQLIDYRF